MASPAVVAPQANGVAALSRPDSPASINSSTKRKREPSDDDEPNLNAPAPPNPPVNGVRASENNKSLVRDFFDVLERYALLHRYFQSTFCLFIFRPATR